MPLTVDLVAPTLTITASDTNLSAGEVTTLTFTFSEIPVGFVRGDINVLGGTLGPLTATDDPKVFTASFTQAGTGTPRVTVANGSYTDTAGNLGTGNTLPLTVDLVAPTLTITASDTNLSAGEVTTLTFTFSEIPVGFVRGDINVLGGTLGPLTATDDPKVFTASFTQAGTGTPRVTVANGSYTDTAGNLGTGNTLPLAADFAVIAGPLDITTATDSGANDLLTNNGNPVITFTGEPGLEIILNGPDGNPVDSDAYEVVETPGANPGSPSTYTIELLDANPSDPDSDPFGDFFNGNPTGNGDNTGDGIYTITATDNAGNTADVGQFEIDTVQPETPDDNNALDSLDITTPTDSGANDLLTNNGNPVLTFTAEPGLGITLIGPDGQPVDPAAYKVTEDPNQPGSYKVELLDATPGDGQRNPFGNFFNGTPTGNNANTGDGLYTITSRDPAGNTAQVGQFTINTQISVTTPLDITTPTDSGPDDLLTNNGNPVLTFTGEPGLTIRLTGANGQPVNPAAYKVTEDPNQPGRYQVELLDATPGDGVINGFGSFLPDGTASGNGPNTKDGIYTITATDRAGNSGPIGQFTIDTTRPTVTFTAFLPDPANPNDRSKWVALPDGSVVDRPFVIVATFSEPVDTFELDDVVISNATLSNFREISADEYTFLVSPTLAGEIVAGIKEQSVQDLVGNNLEQLLEFKIIFEILARPDQGEVDLSKQPNIAIDVLGNDSGKQIQIKDFTQPSRGVVTLDDGGTPDDPSDDKLIYTPTFTENDPGFVGGPYVQHSVTQVQPGLIQLSTDTDSNSIPQQLKFAIQGNSSKTGNTLIAFKVDNPDGSINGIKSGDMGYLQAALRAGKVIFSTLPNNPFNDISRNLAGFATDDLLGFAMIENGSLATALIQLASGVVPTNVFLSLPTGENENSPLRINNIKGSQFRLNFTDSQGGKLTVTGRANGDTLRLGSALQEKGLALIDLREENHSVGVNVEFANSASATNQIGLYTILDESGAIQAATDLNGDGKVNSLDRLLPGEPGYQAQALAISLKLGLTNIGNKASLRLPGGNLYAPFLQSNLNDNTNVYFSYSKANSDGVEHIRLLGDNTFGFEDMPKGGDNDFNDLIVRFNLELSAPSGVFQLFRNQEYTDDFEYTIIDADGQETNSTVDVTVTNPFAPNLKVTLTGNNADFNSEVIIYSVDDDKGQINGIMPGKTGYFEAVLKRSRVIFSAISGSTKPFGESLSRIITEFRSDERISFGLIQSSSLDSARRALASGKPLPQIIWSVAQANGGTNNISVSELSENSFTLGFEDLVGGGDLDYNDLVITVEATGNNKPLGANLQGSKEGELYDLSDTTESQLFVIDVVKNSSFENSIGFYVVEDANGTILDADGNAVTPGDARYAELAIRQRLPLTSNGQPIGARLEPGQILAPFLISNATPEQFLAKNPSNSSTRGSVAFFNYIQANPDRLDHVRLLGDNVFGFEDSLGGGDFDYDDVIVKLNPDNQELLDTTASSQSVQAIFSDITKEASYGLSFGFYKVSDQLGSVVDPLTGKSLTPGTKGYREAALAQSIGQFDFQDGMKNQTLELAGASLFAPYIQVDPGNGVINTYFSYLGANPDKVDHIHSANGLYRFEDSFGGGDMDFNDLTFRLKFNNLG